MLLFYLIHPWRGLHVCLQVTFEAFLDPGGDFLWVISKRGKLSFKLDKEIRTKGTINLPTTLYAFHTKFRCVHRHLPLYSAIKVTGTTSN